MIPVAPSFATRIAPIICAELSTQDGLGLAGIVFGLGELFERKTVL
jgi:hypothetical protein